MAKTIIYSEPESYFPKSIRKSAKIGEYVTDEKKKPALRKNLRQTDPQKFYQQLKSGGRADGREQKRTGLSDSSDSL